MQTFRIILQRTPWYSIALIASIIFTIILFVLNRLSLVYEINELLIIIFAFYGLISLVGGYIITKIIGFEIFPNKKQITGALANGALSVIIIWAIVNFFNSGHSQVYVITMYVFSVFLFFEFLLMRIWQARGINYWQILSLVFVLIPTTLLIDALGEKTLYYPIIILAVGLISLISGRMNHTQLLSPWVNSFWNGISFLTVGLILLPLVTGANLLSIAANLAFQPIWLGLAIGIMTGSILILRFMKYKLHIAKGYMQYKFQLLTLFLMGIGILLSESNVGILIIILILLLAAYSIAEKRLIIKE